MVLDSGPRPLATDIDIRIPSRERAPALPMPGPVAASDALEPSEQIVDPAQVAARREVTEVRLDGSAKAPASALARGPVPLETKPALPKAPAPEKPEVKPETSKPTVLKPDPAVLAREQEAARALAILQGKSVPKAPAVGEQYVVQVAALATQAKVTQLQDRLKEAGIASFTEKVAGQGVIRVRVGPLSKEGAEAMRARLVKLGLSGSVIPT
jgi:DedD protein